MISMASVIKRNSKAAAIIQPIILSRNHTTSYLWPRGWTHTHTHTHSGMKVISENQARASLGPARAWFK